MTTNDQNNSTAVPTPTPASVAAEVPETKSTLSSGEAPETASNTEKTAETSSEVTSDVSSASKKQQVESEPAPLQKLSQFEKESVRGALYQTVEDVVTRFAETFDNSFIENIVADPEPHIGNVCVPLSFIASIPEVKSYAQSLKPDELEHFLVSVITGNNSQLMQKLQPGTYPPLGIVKGSKPLLLRTCFKHNPRNTLILRSVPGDASEADVRALFAGIKEAENLTLTKSTNQCWYAQFDTEDNAMKTHELLRKTVQKIKDHTLSIGVKPSPFYRSPNAAVLQQPPQSENGFAGSSIYPRAPGFPQQMIGYPNMMINPYVMAAWGFPPPPQFFGMQMQYPVQMVPMNMPMDSTQRMHPRYRQQYPQRSPRTHTGGSSGGSGAAQTTTDGSAHPGVGGRQQKGSRQPQTYSQPTGTSQPTGKKQSKSGGGRGRGKGERGSQPHQPQTTAQPQQQRQPQQRTTQPTQQPQQPQQQAQPTQPAQTQRSQPQQRHQQRRGGASGGSSSSSTSRRGGGGGGRSTQSSSSSSAASSTTSKKVAFDLSSFPPLP